MLNYHRMVHGRTSIAVWLLFCFVVPLAGCNDTIVVISSDGQLFLSISILSNNSNRVILVIGGDPQTLEVVLERRGDTGPVNLRLTAVPAGVTTEVKHPGILNTGSVRFQAGSTATPQVDVPLTITASDGQHSDAKQIFLTLTPWPGQVGQ
ncbi:MAG: hypothetical protein L0338_00155 [Acidobacteria bacterium]|nr:hypothetical protein [Acidobacteriota bacterium]